MDYSEATELIIKIALAVFTGIGILFNRKHDKIDEVDVIEDNRRDNSAALVDGSTAIVASAMILIEPLRVEIEQLRTRINELTKRWELSEKRAADCYEKLQKKIELAGE